MAATLALVAAAAAAPAEHAILPPGSSPPTAFWCSWAGPNRTLTLGASNIPSGATVSVTETVSNHSATATEVQVTANGLKVVVPSALPHGAYAVSVVGMAMPFVCGSPDVYWLQGDAGNHSVAGGWVRAFGRNLALPSSGSTLAERRRAIRAGELSAQMQRATQRSAWTEAAQLAAGLGVLAAESVSQRADTTASIILCPTHKTTQDAACATLTSDPDATSQWSAKWWLPATMAPGEYTVTISNGFASSPVDSFISPAEPHVSTIVVKSQASVAWPTKIFEVPASAAGFFEGRMNFSDPSNPYGHGDDCNFGGYPYVCPRDATEAVLSKIAAAGAMGGGIVQLPAGRWYLDTNLILPHNVVLKGAGMSQTGIYFAFANATSAPAVMIGSDCNEVPSRGGPNATLKPDSRYAVEDLSIWIISNHNTIFSVPPCSSGVRVRRVRVRANPFTGAVGWSSGNTTPGFGQSGRWTTWSQFRVPTPAPGGPMHSFVGLFDLQGKNFEISDSDLYSTWVTFRCWSGGATWGLIANNTIYNGGAVHWFDEVAQIIYENNTAIGNSILAQGNNIDTYGGGFVHHVYMGASSFSLVWGNDREVMTYDGNDGASMNTAGYITPDGSISADGTNLTVRFNNTATRPCNTKPVNGGAALVLSGTGAGQVRRILTMAESTASDMCHLSFKLAKAFDVTPDASSVLQFEPFRGENIFENQRYIDTGGFQFWGNAFRNVVAGQVMERTAGILSWGQWNGQTAEDMLSLPNYQQEFIGNVVLDGLRSDHQGIQPGTSSNPTTGAPYPAGSSWLPGHFGDSPQNGGHNIGVMPNFERSTWVDRLLVFREQASDSNGGIMVESGTDITIEDSEIRDLPTNMGPNDCKGGIVVNASTTSGVWLRSNSIETAGHAK